MAQLVCVLVLCTLALAAAAPTEKYTDKYDSVDVDAILKNDRIFKGYMKCLYDEGPCSPDGKELKALLPDALKTDCAKCTKTQKEKSAQVWKYIQENKKEDAERLKKIYNPKEEGSEEKA